MASQASSLVVPYAAYLRVYEPLAAFPEPERGHWRRYAARKRRPGAQDELRRSLRDLLAVPPVPVPPQESAEAFIAEVDGVTCVCPWRTRLRGWLALQELERELPAPVLELALPKVVREQARGDYERWREANPDARPWIRGAVWTVPVRWFVLFSDDEREYEPGAPEPFLRYRTPMAQARRRVARALRALREAGSNTDPDDDESPHLPLIEGLTDVGRWLEEFHPRSLVELDYGGLAHVLSKEWLAEDRSAADVAEGMQALRDGDAERAGLAYERLTERWTSVRDRQFAS
ncbi:hypothetical protein G5C51_15655 [Streptomyces sp. A7024]|uniref:DUF8083 domain-containing protein n=1 Tax=Streptomyces coryli TaxID=1128680 RepID=A0A6G4TZ94_9ACTN|nr:hypothetical protein [Streptomyces coryli]